MLASTEPERILRRVDELAHDVIAREAERIDKQACWPEASLRALQTAGLGGLVVPRSSGGLGQGLLMLAQVCEIIGRSCSSSALCFGMHCVGSMVIGAKATAEQQQRYLAAICDGQHLTTLALSEPGTGAHFYIPETQLAATHPERFLVNGTKTFVTNGGHADSYVVSTTAADPQAPPGMFSCVLVTNGAPGLSWGPPWNGMGMRGNSSRTMELQNVVVERRDLLGEEGDEIWYIFNIIAPCFLMAMAGTYLGIASAAIEEARTHLAQRSYSHSGAVLARQSVLQHRLGCLWARVEGTRRLIYHAAALGDAGAEEALPALLSAKAEVADCAVLVVNEAMTLMGGVAYREGGRMERLLRDVRAAPIMAPTTDILRTWTGRALLGQPLLGD